VGPLLAVLFTFAGVCLIVWVLSLITHDHSWVDRIWSIIPVVYLWIFAGWAGFADTRLDVMAAIVTLWGARLTFNFARKGGYSGVEDYRWAILRGRMPGWQFQLFNLFFITIYQNILLALITLPAYTAYLDRSRPFGALDVALTVVFLGFLAGETIADQQQWNFHAWKRCRSRLRAAVDRHRCGSPDRALRRFNDLYREHHGVQVSGIRRIPVADLRGDSVAAAPRRANN
jgi:steroid 5-alpha reductase family enzyme